MSWVYALKSARFETFEDPVTNFQIDKNEYDLLYGKACNELFDGVEWRVDHFFEENPLVQGCWLFMDNDSRCDLYDVALEMGLVLNLKEIQEGEQTDEKKARKLVESQMQLQITKLHTPVKEALVFAHTYEEKSKRHDVVIAQLQTTTLSSKQRKKLERELRGLKAALVSSI